MAFNNHNRNRLNEKLDLSDISSTQSKPLIYKAPQRSNSNFKKSFTPLNNIKTINTRNTDEIKITQSTQMKLNALENFQISEYNKKSEAKQLDRLSSMTYVSNVSNYLKGSDRALFQTISTPKNFNGKKRKTITKEYLLSENTNKTKYTDDNIETKSNRTTTISDVLSDGKSDSLINLEDLLLLEEKLADIINALNLKTNMANVCFDWWNFYFNCSLCDKFQFYFKDELSKQIIKDNTNMVLIGIMICYKIDFEKINESIHIVKSVILSIHKCFLILCDYILSKISYDSMTNIWVYRLRNLTNLKLQSKYKKNQHINEIKDINTLMYESLTLIINICSKDPIYENIKIYLSRISVLEVSNLNEFFRSNIYKVINKKASNPAGVLQCEKTAPIPFPYIKKPSNMEYTLVLDLDETLINFKPAEDESKGILRLRPYLYEFLDAMSILYEIIIFTASTQDYADQILNIIQKKNDYFSFRLYRQHATIINNDYIKDISKIGRDLKKTIIIDNMPQSFKLQKENGIFIKTFHGDESYDRALLDLIPILSDIAKSRTNDVRKSLQDYREEILKKISSNLFRKS